MDSSKHFIVRQLAVDEPSGNNPSVLPDTYATANLGRVLLQALNPVIADVLLASRSARLVTVRALRATRKSMESHLHRDHAGQAAARADQAEEAPGIAVCNDCPLRRYSGLLSTL